MPVFSIDEGTNNTHKFTILDEAGDPLQPSVITLTHYDRLTGDILNSRTDQNVLNANNVTVTNGAVVWSMQILDNPILDTTLPAEIHVALWEWTTTDGAGKHETIFRVINLSKVP